MSSRQPLIIPIRPKAYVRRTYQGRFKPAAEKYHQWCNSFRALARQANGREPLLLPDRLKIRFVFRAPQLDRHRRGAHTQAPDLDNLVKAVLDALAAGESDAGVYAICAVKQWGETDCITIYDWPEDDDFLPAPNHKRDVTEDQKSLFPREEKAGNGRVRKAQRRRAHEQSRAHE